MEHRGGTPTRTKRWNIDENGAGRAADEQNYPAMSADHKGAKPARTKMGAIDKSKARKALLSS